MATYASFQQQSYCGSQMLAQNSTESQPTPGVRVSAFFERDPRFYKENFRMQKKIYQMLSSDQSRDMLAHTEKVCPLEAPASQPKTQLSSPVKYNAKQTARMCASSLEMWPSAPDRSERLNPSTKRMNPANCQFKNSELQQKPRPNSAMTLQRGYSAKRNSVSKINELKGQTTQGQTNLANHTGVTSGTIRTIQFEPTTRETRQKALQAIHGSSRIFKSINQPRDKDLTSHLSNAKLTSYSVYRPDMVYPVYRIAQKAQPIWKKV